jgi:hypothetical protein
MHSPNLTVTRHRRRITLWQLRNIGGDSARPLRRSAGAQCHAGSRIDAGLL